MTEANDDLPFHESLDWRLEANGTWTLQLSCGDVAAIHLTETNAIFDEVQATISRGNRIIATGSFSDFPNAKAWAENELFPRRPV